MSDIRAMFLAEFGQMLALIRDAYRVAMLDPERMPAAMQQASDYCHRMAGVAGMVGFPLAGEIGALCEGLANMQKHPEKVDVEALIASALEVLARFFQAEADAAAAVSSPGIAAVADEPARPRRQSRRH